MEKTVSVMGGDEVAPPSGSVESVSEPSNVVQCDRDSEPYRVEQVYISMHVQCNIYHK